MMIGDGYRCRLEDQAEMFRVSLSVASIITLVE
jgi:hypothetical protein